ncbi:MAG: 5-(carboxyamino)imidazole ribonucleotide synthase [Burkholderiaceae bacterium]|nr:5-(carboxyamino)imidazole ribonucleotide synthase [Burkholderiaceae bacterium]
MLGGGQLGRMFCMAAQSLGYRVCVLDPGADSPAGSIAERHLRADYLDAAALAELGETCAAVTTEFENVPARALQQLSERTIVAPSADSVGIAQDRIAEKGFVRAAGLPTAPYRPLRSVEDVRQAPAALFPGIVKAARLGYDGKGQALVANAEEACLAFAELGSVPCVLEQRLALDSEVSVLLARGFDGTSLAWDVAGNVHRGGILARTTFPARIDPSLAQHAFDATRRIADALGYVGVLCVEFFVLADATLLVNEIAPRPHNSGHATIDACVTSQFEQQARALAGLPLGEPRLLAPAVMLNLLGDLWFEHRTDAMREPDWSAVLRHPSAKLHLYGKREARRGRKMGHVTILGASVDAASAVADEIERALGIGERGQ